MKKIIAVFFIIPVLSYSQENKCQVDLPALQGTYTGDCKNEKANGKGKAIGEDMYEGNFKNGLPEGKGKYSWKNGSWFEGNFKEGLMDGTGTMHFITPTNKDSIIEGVWKKGLYNRRYEVAYKIHNKTYMVASAVVTSNKSRAEGNEIIITTESVSGGALDMHGEIPKPELNGIDIRKGSFSQRNDVTNTGKRNIYYLRDVIFPFRANFRVGTEEVEVEFFEASSWKIEIKLRQ
ncbi:MAG: hypothetical protein HYX40_11020 [Sphingobacteriales bacterium]|nr:hypothetical protein [Sphingobacteriales bacterium]